MKNFITLFLISLCLISGAAFAISNDSLNEHELKLFFLLIVMPDLVDLNKSEFVNVKQIRTVLDYIFKTEELVRPYYSKKEKE